MDFITLSTGQILGINHVTNCVFLMKLDINNYPGSKGGSGVIQWILNHVPKCSIFVDACAGSGIVGETVAEMCSDTAVYMYEKYLPVWQQLDLKYRNYKKGMIILLPFDSIQHYLNKVKESHTCYDETVFYFDVPYIKETRKSTVDLYGCEWTLEDHLNFFDLIFELEKKGALIIISHYDCDLYRMKLVDWPTSTFQTMTRGGAVIEKLWMNFDIKDYELATTAFVGKDFTDRQRIKRKKENIVKKLKSLPLHERQAIIDHIKIHL